MKQLFAAILISALGSTAVAEPVRYDGKWDFGAFAAVTVLDALTLEYCFHWDKKPQGKDCGKYIYDVDTDGRLRVKIDTGDFLFAVNDNKVLAEFHNKEGKVFFATLK